MTSLSADLTALAPEPHAAGALALVLAAEAPELTRSDVVRLLAAWRARAGAPGSERAAGALEDVARLVALGLGTTGTAVRLWVLGNLAALRLDGKRGRP